LEGGVKDYVFSAGKGGGDKLEKKKKKTEAKSRPPIQSQGGGNDHFVSASGPKEKGENQSVEENSHLLFTTTSKGEGVKPLLGEGGKGNQ